MRHPALPVRLIACIATVLGMSLLTCGQAQAAPGVRYVWAVDDGEKVFRDDLNHPLKAGGTGNPVWDGATVTLFAARNEAVAFQLILEANSEGVGSVDVVVSDLTGSNGGTIRGSHPLPAPNDYLGVGVELFTEHYLNVTQYSYNDPVCGGFYTTAEANPHITGWIPDALIPFAAAAGKGGAPFDIAPDTNQGVWVDIYVPKGVPAGSYTGTVTITVSAAPAAEIPLELEVMDFTLPEENHYKSMVFYSRENIAARHNTGCCTQEMWDTILDYHRMAHRHRLELIGSGDWEEIEHIGGTITGGAFTAADGYEGPGEGIGNSLFSVHTYGASFGETEAQYRANSDAWVNWFDANAPNVEYFLYLTDEPGPDMYDWIRDRGSWIDNNPGPGHRLPVFISRWPITELIGSIDIWCMQSPWYDPGVIAAARARGEKAWVYAGNRPQTPMDVMDEYGVAMRLKPWIAYKCDVRRWFTWESSHWYANRNEVPNDAPKNVFADPLTFYCGGPGGYGNGDGTMFYPGEDNVFPDQDREFPGPMSSIRMKMYRRGVQDYEYMWLATRNGYGAEVQSVLDSALPHVMWDAVSVPDWSNSNADYEAIRRQLAGLITTPNTQPGVGVSVTVGDTTVTFEEVTSEGTTTIIVSDPPPAPAPEPLTFLQDCVYHIATTAEISGAMTVAVDYSDTNYPPVLGERLSVLLWDGSQWVDITLLPVDTANYIIRGQFTPGAERDWFIALALDRPPVPKVKVMFEGCSDGRFAVPGLFVADADLSNIIRVTLPARGTAWRPECVCGCGEVTSALSPDGTRVIMSRLDIGTLKMLDLGALLQAPGQETRTLTNESGQPILGSMPSWSPDGDRIVYLGDSETGDRLAGFFVVNADGTDAHPLYLLPESHPWSNWGIKWLEWSPDGAKIAFQAGSDFNREAHLYVLENLDDPGGPSTRQLTDDDAYTEIHPHWAPDGRHIAFTRSARGSAYWEGSEIWVLDVDTGAAARITDAPGTVQLVRGWCPYDGCIHYGTYPAFEFGARESICRMLPDGTGSEVLTTDLTPIRAMIDRLTWLPTGVWMDGLNALPGESVAPKMGIADADDLAGVQARVRFNGLSMYSAELGDSILDWAMPSPVIGSATASILAYAPDPGSQSLWGSGHLFDLNMVNPPSALPGETRLMSFDSLLLSDEWGEPVQRTTFSGGIHTIPFAGLQVSGIAGPVGADPVDPMLVPVTITALDRDGWTMPECSATVALGAVHSWQQPVFFDAVAPASVALAGGVWSGEVTLTEPHEFVHLVAHWEDIGVYSNRVQAIGKGDANADNQVSIFDVVKIANMAIGRGTWADWQLWAADLNGDGEINVFDVVICANKAMEGMQSLSVGRGAPVAAPAGPVTVTTTTTSTSTQTTVAVELSECAGLAGAQVELKYDAKQLQYAGMTRGALLAGKSSWAALDNDLGGTVKAIAYTASGEVLPGGKGAILTFSFNRAGKGAAKVELTSVKLADADGREVVCQIGRDKPWGKSK